MRSTQTFAASLAGSGRIRYNKKEACDEIEYLRGGKLTKKGRKIS